MGYESLQEQGRQDVVRLSNDIAAVLPARNSGGTGW